MAVTTQLKTGNIVMTGNKELDGFFEGLTPKLQRSALRKTVKAGGGVLRKEIRRQLRVMLGRPSRRRAAPPKRDKLGRFKARRGRKRNRTESTGGLARSVSVRPWTKPGKGIIGVVVGPKWPEGAHGHLIEFGHKIVVKGVNTGRRTAPRPFQRNAMAKARRAILQAESAKMKAEMRKLKAK